MAANTKKRPPFEREEDMLDFARSYLSSGFPNDERAGCPSDEALRAFAKRPARKIEWISDHLTSCSPCFNAYMAHLAHERETAVQLRTSGWTTRSLVTVGVAVMIMMIGIYIFSTKRNIGSDIARSTPSANKPESPTQASKAPVPISALIDLSSAVPVRGIPEDGEVSLAPQVIPLSPAVDLILQLPIGSEMREYLVTLSSKRHAVWSGSAQAHQENGQVLLVIRADFSHVSAGKYQMAVVSKGFRITLPVVIKII
jgi:hypothetical protein